MRKKRDEKITRNREEEKDILRESVKMEMEILVRPNLWGWWGIRINLRGRRVILIRKMGKGFEKTH